MTYEERLAEIEALASKLEADGLSFEALLNTYERSVVLLRECQQQLHDAEQRLQVLGPLVEEGEEDTIEEDDEILLPYVENYDEDGGNE